MSEHDDWGPQDLDEIERRNHERENIARLTDEHERICSVLGEHPDTGIDSIEQKIADIRHEARDYCNVAAEVARLRRALAQDAQDWADTDTRVRDAARPHLPALQVDGDSVSVPSIADVVEALVAEVVRLKYLLDIAERGAEQLEDRLSTENERLREVACAMSDELSRLLAVLGDEDHKIISALLARFDEVEV